MIGECFTGAENDPLHQRTVPLSKRSHPSRGWLRFDDTGGICAEKKVPEIILNRWFPARCTSLSQQQKSDTRLTNQIVLFSILKRKGIFRIIERDPGCKNGIGSERHERGGTEMRPISFRYNRLFLNRIALFACVMILVTAFLPAAARRRITARSCISNC